ncbi:unnamed protein product, partial [Staurois parvus]
HQQTHTNRDTPRHVHYQGQTDHLETRALPEGPGSVGGPMRCPWYLFHRLFLVWARTQGPHDPLLPGGPMSCQSAPANGEESG